MQTFDSIKFKVEDNFLNIESGDDLFKMIPVDGRFSIGIQGNGDFTISTSNGMIIIDGNLIKNYKLVLKFKLTGVKIQ